MFKFLHIADIHFDAPLSSKDNRLRTELKKSQKNAFKNAIDLCINEKVDGLIIAGDLFDNERVSLETEKFLWESFDQLEKEKIQVFYSPGNHDPVIAMQVKFGENVHVFNRDTPFEYILKDDNHDECHILGIGHLNNNEKRNLIKKFPQKTDGHIYVGVAHTMVESVEADQTKGKYLPTTLDDLIDKKYDYWALGHIHQRTQFRDLPIFYSGTIQGLNINETGLKGGNLITFKDGVSDIKFVSLNGIYYHQTQLDISGEYDTELECYKHIKDKLADQIDLVKFSHGQVILRVTFSGKTNLVNYFAHDENINYIEEELAQDLGIKALEVKKSGIYGMKTLEELSLDNPVLEEVMDLLDHPEMDSKFYESIQALKLQYFESDIEAKELIEDNKAEILEYLMSYFTGDES